MALRTLNLSREELLAVKQRCDEIGLKGERWALAHERKRLTRADRRGLASRIEWVSQERPYEGYDISSFECSGVARYIEVKSTIGQSRSFEMSDNEWRRSEEVGDRYFIYRVTKIHSSPNLLVFQNPAALLSSGVLRRDPSSWTVSIMRI